MHIYPPFEGFSNEGFSFLRKLKRNNRREWFQARKEEYQEFLQEPMRSLTYELGRLCAKSAPDVVFNPRKAVYRIYRDVRFSANKDPYKTNVGASFGLGPKSKLEETPGFYLQIAPGECFLASGLYMPSSRQLRAIRTSIDQNPEALKKIIFAPGFRRKFKSLPGEKLKRKPNGYDITHPNIELLKYKQFYIYLPYADAQTKKKNFAKTVAKDIEAMMPFNKWVLQASR